MTYRKPYAISTRAPSYYRPMDLAILIVVIVCVILFIQGTSGRVIAAPPKPPSHLSQTLIDTYETHGLMFIDTQSSLDNYPRSTEIWHRIRDHYKIHRPISQWHAQVRIKRHRDYYLRHSHSLKTILSRSQPFLYYIVEQLHQHGLPSELALLPVIESAYNPYATSRANAGGLWQFIPMTAKDYYLNRTAWYDGRYDVIAATRAAIHYLKDLNRRLNGDWLLTLAAYNAGYTTVTQSIRRNKANNLPTDYWSLRLPNETRHYIPRLLAVAEIIEAPEKFAFTPPTIPNRPAITIIKTDKRVLLSDLALLAGINPKQLARYNPGYRLGYTPATGIHPIVVPTELKSQFEEALTQYTLDESKLWPSYRVQLGDNLTRIAKAFQSSISSIRTANSLKNDLIIENQLLLIPHKPSIINDSYYD